MDGMRMDLTVPADLQVPLEVISITLRTTIGIQHLILT